jgi:hypothetical protein
VFRGGTWVKNGPCARTGRTQTEQPIAVHHEGYRSIGERGSFPLANSGSRLDFANCDGASIAWPSSVCLNLLRDGCQEAHRALANWVAMRVAARRRSAAATSPRTGGQQSGRLEVRKSWNRRFFGKRWTSVQNTCPVHTMNSSGTFPLSVPTNGLGSTPSLPPDDDLRLGERNRSRQTDRDLLQSARVNRKRTQHPDDDQVTRAVQATLPPLCRNSLCGFCTDINRFHLALSVSFGRPAAVSRFFEIRARASADG